MQSEAGPSHHYRSLLFTPADAARKIERALSSSADIVILDLEDAVAPTSKDDARRNVREVLQSRPGRAVGVRINAAGTSWYVQDIAALAGATPELVMLPKCRSVGDVIRLSHQLDVVEVLSAMAQHAVAILPLVTEDAGSLQAMDYRGAGGRLAGLGFAGEDLAADTGVTPRDGCQLNPLLAHARVAVSLAATAAGVAAIDTPYPDPRDLTNLATDVDQAIHLGFTGKMCIHPDQIAVVHAAFRPAAHRVQWAEAVIAAFAEAGGGVATLDGKMIDRAHLRMAHRFMGAAEAGRDDE